MPEGRQLLCFSVAAILKSTVEAAPALGFVEVEERLGFGRCSALALGPALVRRILVQRVLAPAHRLPVVPESDERHGQHQRDQHVAALLRAMVQSYSRDIRPGWRRLLFAQSTLQHHSSFSQRLAERELNVPPGGQFQVAYRPNPSVKSPIRWRRARCPVVRMAPLRKGDWRCPLLFHSTSTVGQHE